MSLHKHTYDWSAFQGSQEALKWNCRDLATVDRVVSLVPQRRVAVQAGGNLGVFPKHLARSFDVVYTFEPDQQLFPMLTANAPETNIIRCQLALGAGPAMVGTSRVRRDGKPNVHEGITHIAGAGVVPTLALDALALPIVDLCCLDLEGWELYALQGAAKTLATCRPVLVVEINKNLGYVGIDPAEVRSLLEVLRYRFVERIHSDEIYVPAEWPC